MTQYDDRVEAVRDKLAAEAWGNQVKDIHGFDSDTTSMWYTDREDGKVVDTRFNNGSIRREILDTGEVVWLGEQVHRSSLLDSFYRAMADYRG